MTLTRDHWPSRAAVQQSLAARFALPPLPPPFEDWFAWCRRMGTQPLVLHTPDWREGEAGEFTGPLPADAPGLLAALEGYRFILNQKASTPEHLVWHDAVDTGQWQAHWVVLHNADGDPLIGDTRHPEVPVLWDWHGAGRWSPQPLFPRLRMLMEHLAVRAPTPGPTPADTAPLVFYTVRLVDLGPQPMRVLTALKEHPDYRQLTGARLLQLKHQLPLLLLDDNISALRKDRLVQDFESLGARVKVTGRTYPAP